LSTYPAACLISVERRTLPGDTQQRVEEEIEALLTRCREDDSALEVAQRTLLVRDPFEVPDDADVVGEVLDSATEVLGTAPALNGVPYWADAAFIAAAGIPTVMFGPSGAGAHAVEEWVSISDTEAVTRILVAVASRICK
jgi:acetylornithine deacetylase